MLGAALSLCTADARKEGRVLPLRVKLDVTARPPWSLAIQGRASMQHPLMFWDVVRRLEVTAGTLRAAAVVSTFGSWIPPAMPFGSRLNIGRVSL